MEHPGATSRVVVRCCRVLMWLQLWSLSLLLLLLLSSVDIDVVLVCLGLGWVGETSFFFARFKLWPSLLLCLVGKLRVPHSR